MRSQLPILISLSLLLFTAEAARAQFADDYFHGGAQFYISNNIANAKEAVDNGLKLYPDDLKLKKLEELLKQQSQQQQSQQNQQQNQNQQQQNQQAKNDQQKQNSPGQNQQDQKPDKQDQKNQQQQQAQNQKDQQDKQGQSSQSQQQKSDGQEKEQQAASQAAGQMTPQEAQRLLDAQKGDEKVLQFKPDGKANNSDRPIKDW